MRTRAAFGPLIGFLAGWALYVGERIALPVFPVAFANYVTFFAPSLTAEEIFIVKAALIAAVTLSNLVGARTGARINDSLTIAKLVTRAILIVARVAGAHVRRARDPAICVQALPPGVVWAGHGRPA